MTFELGPALLFCPGDRSERYAKALERSDGVIIDLEDAVAADAKAAARGSLIESELDPARVIVRVNAPGTTEFVSDMASLSQTDYRTIMVAKAETPKTLAAIDRRFSIIAMCETARAVAVADKLAAVERVTALMWGAEDLVASLGGTSSRKKSGGYRDVARYARSRVLIAAGAAGKAAIDAVHIDLADAKRLAAEAEDAAASGFAAKACIHPSQVPVVREAYRPGPAELSWAQGVLDAARGQRGVFSFEGRMVDAPVLRHARSLLRRAAG